MNEKIKELKKLYKKSDAEDKIYVDQLLDWLNAYLIKYGPGPHTEDGGNNPNDPPTPPKPPK